MDRNGDGNGWQRWRGQIDSRLDDAEDSVRDLWKFKENADRRIAVMETKMVVLAAIAAAIGAMLPGVVQAIVKHL
jgi:hypothetical protein